MRSASMQARRVTHRFRSAKWSPSWKGLPVAGCGRAPAAPGGGLRPTRTPRATSPLAIPALRARTYRGGKVELVSPLDDTEVYQRTLIAYPSEALRITGVMTVPAGAGPFPVLLLNHGDIPPEQYTTGAGTAEAADFLQCLPTAPCQPGDVCTLNLSFCDAAIATPSPPIEP